MVEEDGTDYLILYAHPNPRSFNAALRKRVEEKLREQEKPYLVRDLYLLHFNPLLSAQDFFSFSRGEVPEDIKKEQGFIRQAGTIIFIYPVWWFGMPAILKGYIDRVFSRGFAYSPGEDGKVKGLLTGKKAVILNTTGGPRESYEQTGYKEALHRTVETGIMEFCGLTVTRHEYFYAVPAVTDPERESMLERIRTMDI